MLCHHGRCHVGTIGCRHHCMHPCGFEYHLHYLRKGTAEMPEGVPTYSRSTHENHVRQGMLLARRSRGSVESHLSRACPVGRTSVSVRVQNFYAHQMVAKDSGFSFVVISACDQNLVEMEWMPMGLGSPHDAFVVFGIPGSSELHDLPVGAST